jgi:sugar-specific transcriptional regulator TrmB
MIASTKTLDALRTIGLNKYERNLWAALLSRGASTAGELSDISNVPRSRCYDVLETLADRGFVIIQPGKPMKYVAVPPREALERAKKKIMEEAQELVEKIERLKKSESIKELETVYKTSLKVTKLEDLTGALKGRYAMLQQIESMFKKARKSIKLITTAEGLKELAENHLQLIKKASDAGVVIKIAAPITKSTTEIAHALAKYAQIRNIENVEHVERILGRAFIVDGQEFLIGLTDDTKTHPTQDVAFWSQSDHAASLFIEPMFELIWQHAKPVK